MREPFATALTVNETIAKHINDNLPPGTTIVAQNIDELLPGWEAVGYFALRRPDGLTYAVIVAAEKAWDEITLSSGVEGDLGTLGHQGASPEVINALSPADDPRFGVSPNGHRRITLWRNRCLGNAAARLLPT